MTSCNFDRVAEQYDAIRGFPPGVAERICTWMLSRLPRDPAVAELGVGTGRIAVPFIQRGVRYTGFDISEAMLNRLRSKVSDLGRAHVAVADITQPLPLPAQSQDAVVIVQVLHLVDAEQALTQARRILKPHGALVWGNTTHDELSLHRRIPSALHGFVAEMGGGTHPGHKEKAARDLLARWGAASSRHTAAAWQVSQSPRDIVESLRAREMSWTWPIPDDIFARAIAKTEAWAVQEYGDLDRPIENNMSFTVDWYQF